ncbi:MAG: heme biosynthesis HemY N-terminal domain-containing protein [Saezia sp.]
MFRIIRLLLIFAIAIAAAFAMTRLSGTTVSFAMFEKNYAMNTNVFIVLAALAFVSFYFLIRFISNLIHLPERTKRWNLLREERYSNAKLNEASLQYFAGRYSRSLKNVEKALHFHEKNGLFLDRGQGSREFHILSNLLGAANEQRLGNNESANALLQKAIQSAQKSKLSEAPDGLQLMQIEWLISDSKPEQAREAFNKLDPGIANRIAALQLQLQIDRMQNQPLSALKTIKLLAKHRAYQPEEAEKIIIESACKLLETSNDTQELQKIWDSLDKKDKKIPTIIAYAARHFAILGDHKNAHKLIESSWNDFSAMGDEVKNNLLMTLDMTLENADQTWLSRLEKATQNTPNDPMMTYLAGRLCHIQGITGKAQALLEKAARSPDLPILLRQRAWFIIAGQAEKNGELEQANACYKEGVGLLT